MTMHIHADFIKAAAFVLLGSIVAGCQSPSLMGAKNVLTLKSDIPANVENAPLREARQAQQGFRQPLTDLGEKWGLFLFDR